MFAGFRHLFAMMEEREAEFRFGKPVEFGVPSPSARSIGIMQLAENLKVIYGAQQLRGKILSRKDLDHVG